MDIEKMRYFRVVAKEEHMTRAAQKINITQPSLSSIIANMETELGVRLFERVGRQIVLNKYGEVFYKGVDDILDSYDRVLSQLESLKKENDSDVKIAVTGLNFPRKIIAAFAEEYPQIRIIMRLIRADEIESTLKHSDAEIVLSSIGSESDKIRSVQLFEERLCALLPADDPITEKDEISIRELKNRNFALTPPNTAFRVLMDSIFEKAGYEPALAIEGYTEQILEMIAERAAVSVVTESDARIRFCNDKIKRVYLKEDYCRRGVYMLTKANADLTDNGLSFFEFANYERSQYIPDNMED